MIGFVATIIPHMSWGLNWFQIEYAESFCETNGWLNVVYLNNFIKQNESVRDDQSTMGGIVLNREGGGNLVFDRNE